MVNLLLLLGAVIALIGSFIAGFYAGIEHGAKKVGEMSAKAHNKLMQDNLKKSKDN